MRTRSKLGAALLVLMLLQACSKGSDHRLDTGHGMEAYKTSLQEALKDKGFIPLQKKLAKLGVPVHFISAVSGSGLDPLRDRIESLLGTLGPRVFKNEVADRVSLGDETLFADDESEGEEAENSEE